MTEKTKRKIAYIQDHYQHENLSEMSRALNTTPSGIYYWANKLGIRDKLTLPEKSKDETELSESMFFDVDAVGVDGNWLI